MSELYWLNPFSDHHDPEPILRDAFAWENNGIFVALQSVAEEKSIKLPWSDEDTETLDLAYFANHSGGKFCSPVVKLLLQTDAMVDESGRINSTGTQKLASILLRKYLTNWTSLWATNVASYDPIHNYNMYEERDLITTEDEEKVTDSKTGHTGSDTIQHGKVESVEHGKTESTVEQHSGTDSLEKDNLDTVVHGKTTNEVSSHTGSDTTSYGKEETIIHGRENEETNYKYGINTVANDPKPSEKTTSQEGGSTVTVDAGSDQTTKNLTDTTDLTEGGETVTKSAGSEVQSKNLFDEAVFEEGGKTVTSDTGSDVSIKDLQDKTDSKETLDNDGTEHEEIHRYGNIGVTTTQKLIQEERQLWLWNYFDQIFDDLDRELALSFHDPCRV